MMHDKISAYSVFCNLKEIAKKRKLDHCKNNRIYGTCDTNLMKKMISRHMMELVPFITIPETGSQPSTCSYFISKN